MQVSWVPATRVILVIRPAARALWSALAPVLWFFSLWERTRGLLTVQSPEGNNSLCKTKDSELSKHACKEQKSGVYTSIHPSLRFITYWKNPTETSAVLLSVNISLQIFLTTYFPLPFFPMIFLQLFFFFLPGKIILLKIANRFKTNYIINPNFWIFGFRLYCLFLWFLLTSLYRKLLFFHAEHVILMLLGISESIYHNANILYASWG